MAYGFSIPLFHIHLFGGKKIKEQHCAHFCLRGTPVAYCFSISLFNIHSFGVKKIKLRIVCIGTCDIHLLNLFGASPSTAEDCRVLQFASCSELLLLLLLLLILPLGYKKL